MPDRAKIIVCVFIGLIIAASHYEDWRLDHNSNWGEFALIKIAGR